MKFNITITAEFPQEKGLDFLKPEAKSFLYIKSLQDGIEKAFKKIDISQTTEGEKKIVPEKYNISVEAVGK